MFWAQNMRPRVTVKEFAAGASIPASCSFILPIEPSWASGSSWGVNHEAKMGLDPNPWVRVGLKVCAYGLRSIEGQHRDVLILLVILVDFCPLTSARRAASKACEIMRARHGQRNMASPKSCGCQKPTSRAFLLAVATWKRCTGYPLTQSAKVQNFWSFNS